MSFWVCVSVSDLDFTLCMEDPVGLPLPSFALLQMQSKLNQIVSLSAAVEDTEWEEEPDDGDVPPIPIPSLQPKSH